MAKKAMEVVATANGYYGNKVRVPGERFLIAEEGDFSDAWMAKGGDKPEAERFVGTGGTDGVVGTSIKVTDPSDRTAKERKDLAAAGISDNDDRTRDIASNRMGDAPLPDPEPSKPVVVVAKTADKK